MESTLKLQSIEDTLAAVTERLGRLDHFLQQFEDWANEPGDRLINRVELRELYGDCSDATIVRHTKAGLIPQPKKINGRNYWWYSEVVAKLRELPDCDLSDPAKEALRRGRRLRQV